MTRPHVLLFLAALALAAAMLLSPGDGQAPVFFGDWR